MAGSSDKPLNRSQFENPDTISRFQYVNVGKITIPNSDGVALDAETMRPPAIPYSLDGSGKARSANDRFNLPHDAMGVYSAYPSMSPKYVKHNGGTLAVNLGGLARIYIPVSREDSLRRIYASFERRNKSTEKVARRVFGLGKNGGEDTGAGYIDFVLMNVSQVLDEKFQVSEVLEDNYVAFFFGQRAPMWTFSGALMNTYQDDWTMNMWRLYSEMGRGTRLAQRGLLMSIRFDSMIVTGGMTRFQWDLTSSNELFTSFSFQFLVNNIMPLRGSFCPPSELPVAYNGFYDVDMDFEALNTYEGVMPVVNPSEADIKVNDQAAVTSPSLAEPSIEDVIQGIGAYGDHTDPNVYDTNVESTLSSLFGSTTQVSSNPARIPMREL
jgi:hypothetical protein